MADETIADGSAIPVAVIMSRRMSTHRQWSYPDWRLDGVVAGAVAAAEPLRQRVHTDQGVDEFVWPGFVLRLYKDSAESYWYNLVGTTPSLFVVCRENADGDLEPCLVTADHDEAGAHMEADDTVFSTPMPPEIHQRLERYVMDHYKPEPPRKRRRENWKEEAIGPRTGKR
jgi:hypothetical protein